jgi:hypothetical protein
MNLEEFATWWESSQLSGSTKQSKGRYSAPALNRARMFILV